MASSMRVLYRRRNRCRRSGSHFLSGPLQQTACRRRRRDLDAQIAARTRILNTLVLDHPKLLADLRADLDERVPIVRAKVFGFR